jgi:hypothetical protein
MSFMRNGMLAAVVAVAGMGAGTAQGAFKTLDDAGWVVSWPDSQQTSITLEALSPDKQTATIDISATLDVTRIQSAGFLNPLVLTFQQTKPDAAPYFILHSFIENQTGHAWDGVSFKVVQNPSVTFAVQDTAGGGPGIAPYDTVLLDPTSRILSFTDGLLGNKQTFTTTVQSNPLMVAADPASNGINGDFSMKIGANMVSHMPEPGTATIFALGGLLVLVDRRRA